MKQQHLKILRYNMGTDKKAFVQFKDFFDAAIFNATIVAYSGASVADLISMHMDFYNPILPILLNTQPKTTIYYFSKFTVPQTGFVV